MFWKRFFGSQPRNADAWPLYEAILAQARTPALYRDFGVPDSVDGRFEAIVLHLVLVLRRLKRDFPEGLDLAKRVKRMAEGFLGRLGAYDEALDKLPVSGDTGLRAVLQRNVFGTLAAGQGDAGGLAAYALAQLAALEAQDGAALRQGRVSFADAPMAAEKG